MNIALRRLFIMSETLSRILKKDKPKADIVKGMTKAFFKKTNADEAVISIKPNSYTRTSQQNRLYHSLVDQVRFETNNTKRAIKIYCQSEFLETRIEEVAGKSKVVLKSTTELTTKEMGLFLDDVIAWAENDLGMQLNLPDDWRELIS
jgi:predicted small secreted protein